jgi:hypothetical protein
MFDPQDNANGTWGGSLFPANGPHVMEVVEAEPRESSAGNPMVVMTFRICGAGDPDEGKEIRYQYYMVSGKAAGKYRDLCLAIDPKMGVHDPTDHAAVQKLLCRRPFVGTTKTEDETYNGETREKCRLLGHRQAKANEIPKAKPSNVTAPVDDGIPF